MIFWWSNAQLKIIKICKYNTIKIYLSKNARIFILFDVNYLGNTNASRKLVFQWDYYQSLSLSSGSKSWQDNFNSFHMIKQAMVALECKTRCPGADMIWSHTPISLTVKCYSPHFFVCWVIMDGSQITKLLFF